MFIDDGIEDEYQYLLLCFVLFLSLACSRLHILFHSWVKPAYFFCDFNAGIYVTCRALAQGLTYVVFMSGLTVNHV